MNVSQPNRTGGYEDQPFVAEMYDQVPLHAQRGDAEFYLECAKEFGGPVLELGCGTGRVLLEIARAGIDITGLDLFNPSIAIIVDEKHKKEWGEEPEFLLQDGTTVRRRFRTKTVDLHNQVSEVEIIYYKTHPDGQSEKLVHSFPMRYTFRYEMEHLLVRSGLQVEAMYAGFQKEQFGSVYPGELIFVARRSR